MKAKSAAVRLRTIRDEFNITPEELAGAIGVSGFRTVYKWQSGEREMPGPLVTLLDLLDDVPEARKWFMQKIKDARDKAGLRGVRS